jgi:uncharacterized heparinase superfamily protein
VVIVDSGIPPAPGFDRRAHAGIGSFEMSVGRERFIVNCGAHPGAGPWRAALAATAAHSTVTVADTNQFELIDGGGVRRRPQPTETKREDGPGSALVEITHNGYAGLGVLHRRRLFLCDNGNDFRGEDVIAGSAAQPFTIRFHLHPDVQASLTGSGNAALMRLGDGAGWRFRCGVETLSLEKGIYFGTGSAPRGSTVLVITGESRPGEDSIVRWRFHRDKRPLPQSPD